ncbi:MULTISPECIES: hypothetical protein [unclassified Embleya]|uniref:hypothetical protein n=1 Tax=unclassified Embleya TaxID=2699296 RepID=UPI0033CA20CB
MADSQSIEEIMRKLRAQTALSAEEVLTLQGHVDQLENRSSVDTTHHTTHSTPNSHYTDHHTSLQEIQGLLDHLHESAAAPGGTPCHEGGHKPSPAQSPPQHGAGS